MPLLLLYEWVALATAAHGSSPDLPDLERAFQLKQEHNCLRKQREALCRWQAQPCGFSDEEQLAELLENVNTTSDRLQSCQFWGKSGIRRQHQSIRRALSE